MAGFYIPKSHSPRTSPSSTPTPPGHPGNGGDTAKEQAQHQPSITPSATPVTNKPVIANFSVETFVGGQAHAIDYISGVTAANCSLELLSPDSKQNKDLSGQLVWAGQYYDCGFGAIPGVTENGTWSATLTVTSIAGASSTANTTFKVGAN